MVTGLEGQWPVPFTRFLWKLQEFAWPLCAPPWYVWACGPLEVRHACVVKPCMLQPSVVLYFDVARGLVLPGAWSSSGEALWTAGTHACLTAVSAVAN